MNKKKSLNKFKIILTLLLFAASFLLLFIASKSSGFAQWYRQSIYAACVWLTGKFTNLFPFSLSEILLYLLVLTLLLSGLSLLIRLFWKKGDRKNVFSWLTNLFFSASILFFLYVCNCGINYHNLSFAETSNITPQEYSAAELNEVCQWLTEEVNALSTEVKRDENGVMMLAPDTAKEATEVMASLGKTYPELSGTYARPKGLLLSEILSYQHLSGIYSPFTIEANYNQDMTDYNIPFTMCHELAHLRGFMSEDEANFIAFLACSGAEDSSFRYSGLLSGWIYCMNALYKADPAAHASLRETLSPACEADLRANSEFWNRFDGKVAEVSNKVNDTYLKANGQEEGVMRYNLMVDLVVAYYQQAIH